MKTMKRILSIAGSDPSGGAGLQRDLQTYRDLGVYGLSVVAAVTSQNSQGVQDSVTLDATVVESQLKSIFADLRPDSVKTGMLGTKENVEAVYKFLKKEKMEILVVDPVLKSSSGFTLLEEDAIPAMKKLIGITTLTTPNTREAEILTGRDIDSMDDKKKAAEIIGACVITSGDADAKDLLYYDGEYTELAGVKKNVSVHGTGCMFSSAVTVYLAQGFDVPDAVEKAKTYVAGKIASSFTLGGGVKFAVQEDEMVNELSTAIHSFVSNKDSINVAPEVGINMVYARKEASKLGDVYGLSGRIVKAGGRLVPVGELMLGGSSHMARIILTVMKHDTVMRSAMNIKYSPSTVEALGKAGLSASSFDRGKQPEDTATMEWGTSKAIESFGSVPDCIFDEGAVGKEPMIRILGKTPGKVVEKTLMAIRELG